MRTKDPRAIGARRTAGSASIRARGPGAGGRGPGAGGRRRDRARRGRTSTAGQEGLRSRHRREPYITTTVSAGLRHRQEPITSPKRANSTARDHNEDRVREWRALQLQRLGLSRLLAGRFAEIVDWHEVAALVERGCPPELALCPDHNVQLGVPR